MQAGSYSYIKCNYDTKKTASLKYARTLTLTLIMWCPHFNAISQLASYLVAAAIAIASHGHTFTGVWRWRP